MLPRVARHQHHHLRMSARCSAWRSLPGEAAVGVAVAEGRSAVAWCDGLPARLVADVGAVLVMVVCLVSAFVGQGSIVDLVT
jgi:hypothetical protein